MSSPPPPVEGWMPIAFGALDVRGVRGLADEADIVVVPCEPGDALGLLGHGAELWRRLVAGSPVPPGEFTAEERAMLSSMREAGIAAFGVSHPARVTHLDPPRLSSALHELVYALTQRVAEQHGIPCVFVKGPALHHQGLRDREHSGDVDVWCAPARWDDLARALAVWGWTRDPDPWRGSSVHHTATMVPLSWGCEIDLHRRFPGLTLDDAAAFEVVQRHAVPLRYAGVELRVPAADTHAVLAALHAVRPAIGGGARTDHAVTTATALLSAVPGTVERARELGAVPVLRRELATIVPDAALAADDTGVPRDWAWRGQPDTVHAYWVALRSTSPLTRVRLLARLVWPSAEVALASARRAGHPTTDPRRARIERLARALHQWTASRRERRDAKKENP